MSDIVVGIDASPDAARALTWAIAEARIHGTDVRAILAWTPDRPPYGIRRSPSVDLETAAQDLLHTAVAAVTAGDTAVKIHEWAVRADPVDALLADSTDAAMLVVGARGLGPARRLLTGSVSATLAHEARVPVVVVRDTPGRPARGPRPVLVGVDGSPAALTALRWAAREASLRDAPLRVIHAWQVTPPIYGGYYLIPTEIIGEGAHALLDKAVADGLGDTPGVDYQADTVHGPTARTLIDAAATAQLLVVGSRGHGGFPELLLGSTSHQCLLHAPCPVAIIHGRHAT